MKYNSCFFVPKLSVTALFVGISLISFSQEVSGVELDGTTLELKLIENKKNNRPATENIVSYFDISLDKQPSTDLIEIMISEIKKIKGVKDCKFNENKKVVLISEKTMNNSIIPLFEEVIESREIIIDRYSEKIIDIQK